MSFNARCGICRVNIALSYELTPEDMGQASAREVHDRIIWRAMCRAHYDCYGHELAQIDLAAERPPNEPVHLYAEKRAPGSPVVAACGRASGTFLTALARSSVTCPDCLKMMGE